MNIANTGGDDLPRVVVGREIEFEAYDSLPEDMRRQLREMSVQWDATGVCHLIGKYGLDSVVRLLRKVEGDMQTAYRKRCVPL